MLKAVDFLARPGGATMQELGDELEVDRRTAYRIRETLEELGFPLYDDTSNLDGKKRYRFEASYLKKLPNLSIPELNLTLSELIALYFIRGNGKLFGGTDIERNIESAYTKLDAFMPEGLARNLEKVKTLFVASSKFAKDYRDKQDIIETITDAIFRQQTCLVGYHSFHDDKMKGFKIDPLKFFERDGGLYLFVRTTKYGDIRVLAVERINSLTMTEATFSQPENFDPDTLLENAFSIVYDEPVEVKIHFSKEVARYIKERRWSKEQIITEQTDGSIILDLKTSGWMDVKKWLLSFGAEAELLEPEQLRSEIIEALELTTGAYLRKQR
ncbi:MAG TPA: WYL domain-containing transcriptional regulator [Desulfuromonadales bacterium]|nr:WYL domain-containing transcriptional regulator [Desulfuromonadales bacterium]